MSTSTKLFSLMLVITTFFMMFLLGFSSATFHVGDSLLFVGLNYNEVTEVSGVTEYELCDSSSPIAVHIGNDFVTLTKPGLRYFISSNHTRCLKGHKLQVLVIDEPSRPSKIFKIVISEPNGRSLPEANDYFFKVIDDLVRQNEPKFHYYRNSKTGRIEFKRRADVTPNTDL